MVADDFPGLKALRNYMIFNSSADLYLFFQFSFLVCSCTKSFSPYLITVLSLVGSSRF